MQTWLELNTTNWFLILPLIMDNVFALFGVVFVKIAIEHSKLGNLFSSTYSCFEICCKPSMTDRLSNYSWDVHKDPGCGIDPLHDFCYGAVSPRIGQKKMTTQNQYSAGFGECQVMLFRQDTVQLEHGANETSAPSETQYWLPSARPFQHLRKLSTGSLSSAKDARYTVTVIAKAKGSSDDFVFHTGAQ